MGARARALAAARKAGKVAYHNLASYTLTNGWFDGVDAQAFARESFADNFGECSRQLQELVEPAFREALEREYAPEGPESPDFPVLDCLLSVSTPRVVREVPSPIAGVINARAREQLARRLEG